MPVSDETLYAIANLSVGTPVTDDTDFTAMTPAQVAAKYVLSSYGGDAGSYVYAPGADGDYDALDPDDPPVTDRGLWAVGAFTNYAVNGLLAGAVAGSPGTMPTGWTLYQATLVEVGVASYKGLPLLEVVATADTTYIYENNQSFAVAEGDVSVFGGFFSADDWAGTAKLLIQDDWGSGTYSEELTINGEMYYKSVSRTAASNLSRNARLALVSEPSSGVTATFRVAGKQCTKGLAFMPPVLALSSAATTTKLAAITQREVSVWKPFVVVIEATTGEDPGAHQVLYSLSRSANELIEIYRATSTHQITLKIRSGGVDHTKTLGSVADNTAFSVAINVFASFTAASLNGGTTQVLVAPKPSGVLTLESIGCKHDGTLQCGGPIAECNLIHPAVYTAEQLEAA